MKKYGEGDAGAAEKNVKIKGDNMNDTYFAGIAVFCLMVIIGIYIYLFCESRSGENTNKNNPNKR